MSKLLYAVCILSLAVSACGHKDNGVQESPLSRGMTEVSAKSYSIQNSNCQFAIKYDRNFQKASVTSNSPRCYNENLASGLIFDCDEGRGVCVSTPEVVEERGDRRNHESIPPRFKIYYRMAIVGVEASRVPVIEQVKARIDSGDIVSVRGMSIN